MTMASYGHFFPLVIIYYLFQSQYVKPWKMSSSSTSYHSNSMSSRNAGACTVFAYLPASSWVATLTFSILSPAQTGYPYYSDASCLLHFQPSANPWALSWEVAEASTRGCRAPATAWVPPLLQPEPIAQEISLFILVTWKKLVPCSNY